MRRTRRATGGGPVDVDHSSRMCPGPPEAFGTKVERETSGGAVGGRASATVAIATDRDRGPNAPRDDTITGHATLGPLSTML